MTGWIGFRTVGSRAGEIRPRCTLLLPALAGFGARRPGGGSARSRPSHVPGDLVLKQGDFVEGGHDAVETSGDDSGQVGFQQVVDFANRLGGQVHETTQGRAGCIEIRAHDDFLIESRAKRIRYFDSIHPNSAESTRRPMFRSPACPCLQIHFQPRLCPRLPIGIRLKRPFTHRIPVGRRSAWACK